MVLALAGDSTITRFLATLSSLFRRDTVLSQTKREKLAGMLCHDSPQLKLQKQFKHRCRGQSRALDNRINMKLSAAFRNCNIVLTSVSSDSPIPPSSLRLVTERF